MKAQPKSDIFSKRKRSEVMSVIRSKNTGLEKRVFLALRRRGITFKKHYDRIIGKPDIVIPASKKVVFIDSDFWHGWRYPSWSHKFTSDFWKKKIESNRRRDRFVTRKLRSLGWKVLRVWTHQLTGKRSNDTLDKMVRFLR
jgi:DNA mismatch endonuclease (patch repair protein)